jgi:phage shock protein E
MAGVLSRHPELPFPIPRGAQMNPTFVYVAAGALLLMWVARMLLRRGRLAGADAHRLVAAGARLVDVRTPGEFAAGHLPGAINLPLAELERGLGSLGSKDGTIVLYCRSGSRSALARRMLLASGFTAVHDLGAMSSW